MVRGMIIYPEVDIAMRLKNWDNKQLSKECGINYQTLRRRFTGKSRLTFSEAVSIKKSLQYKGDIECLFNKEVRYENHDD